MPDPIRLDGKVAIVTGAARGLGRAMAEGLLHAGANVMFTDIAADALDRTGAAATIAGDITVQADCERIVAETVKRFGALHVLVNNAGKGPALLEARRAQRR
jgi:NAD(P)-dependent dehydrogenase (short-subunit alcohol dehydrogenase family)